MVVALKQPTNQLQLVNHHELSLWSQESLQFIRESTVLVAFWVKERFSKDWWQQSSIDYSSI
jgi:hypothetical protein